MALFPPAHLSEVTLPIIGLLIEVLDLFVAIEGEEEVVGGVEDFGELCGNHLVACFSHALCLCFLTGPRSSGYGAPGPPTTSRPEQQ
jgi:hypothetical protein